MFSKTMSKAYCRDPVDRIEGYEQAAASHELFACHHRFAEMGLSRKDLKEMGLYYKRPACELIFMPYEEHNRFHSTAIPSDVSIGSRFQKNHIPIFTADHSRHISEAKRGVKQSPEHIAHIIEAQKATRSSFEYRENARKRMVTRFTNPEEKDFQSVRISKLWENSQYRKEQCAKLTKAIKTDAENYRNYKNAGGTLSWNEWRRGNSPYNIYRSKGGTLPRPNWLRHGKPTHD